MLTVVKHPDTNEIQVSSLVYLVSKLDCSTPLFPKNSPYNFCYVIVDARKRFVTVWYGAFVPFW